MNNQDCDQHQQGEQDKAHSKGDKVEIDEKTRMIMRLSSSLRRCKTVGSETLCRDFECDLEGMGASESQFGLCWGICLPVGKTVQALLHLSKLSFFVAKEAC